MNYSEQLRDPRWIERRKEIIEKAGCKCEKCESENNLQVHHGMYMKGKLAWEYPDELLYCLCGTCHWDIQEFMNLLNYEAGKKQLYADVIFNLVRDFKCDRNGVEVQRCIYDEPETYKFIL